MPPALSHLIAAIRELASQWIRSISRIPKLWRLVKIDRVAAALVVGAVAVLVFELYFYPEFEYGLAASLAALLLLLALLMIAVWDVMLALFSPRTIRPRRPFFPIPSALRPVLFGIGLIAGLYFGSEHW